MGRAYSRAKINMFSIDTYKQNIRDEPLASGVILAVLFSAITDDIALSILLAYWVVLICQG